MDIEKGAVILIPGDAGKDSEEFKVTRKQAIQSKLIESMLQDDEDDESSQIPLIDVKHSILGHVVAFLRILSDAHDGTWTPIEKPIKSSDMQTVLGPGMKRYVAFINSFDIQTLQDVILAANYMDIPSLLDLSVCKLATLIRDKEPADVKALFGITTPISPEEEKHIRDSNPWIFEVPKNSN